MGIREEASTPTVFSTSEELTQSTTTTEMAMEPSSMTAFDAAMMPNALPALTNKKTLNTHTSVHKAPQPVTTGTVTSRTTITQTTNADMMGALRTTMTKTTSTLTTKQTTSARATTTIKTTTVTLKLQSQALPDWALAIVE